MKSMLFFSLIVALFTPITAQEVCSEFNFDDLEYAAVARIKGRTGTRAYFHAEDTNCMVNGNCRMPQFVVPNDYVLVSSPTDYSACALYVNGRTGVETKGWIKGEQISYNSAPPLASWNGTWRTDYGANITLRVRNGQIQASGTTTFRQNSGAFSGTARISDGILTITEGDCKVRLVNLGQQLYVADNMMCGGINVSFTGTYKKRR